MSELIINKKDNNYEVCVLENGSICESYKYNEENDNIMGNIYLGKVKNVVDGMQAAFIDIGMKKNAFISIKDALPKVDIVKEKQVITTQISKVLKQDQYILVQVKKMPTEEKGARVSTHITIPGNYIVLMPNIEIITISQKIIDNKEKDRLVNIIKNILHKGYGAIIRTDALGISKEQLEQDIKELLDTWKDIVSKTNKGDEIKLLYNEHELASKVGRELINQTLDKLYVNDAAIYEKLKKLLEKKDTEGRIEIELFENEDIINKFGLKTELEAVDSRKIWLKCGGYIVIDKTEALTAIDVNSGKYIGNSNLEQTALEVNKEAAIEIMKQIRLKDIGGIIIIDYIDLINKEDQCKIIDIMKNEALKDKSKIDIKGYTELNLVELTRKMMNI